MVVADGEEEVEGCSERGGRVVCGAGGVEGGEGGPGQVVEPLGVEGVEGGGGQEGAEGCGGDVGRAGGWFGDAGCSVVAGGAESVAYAGGVRVGGGVALEGADYCVVVGVRGAALGCVGPVVAEVGAGAYCGKVP